MEAIFLWMAGSLSRKRAAVVRKTAEIDRHLEELLRPLPRHLLDVDAPFGAHHEDGELVAAVEHHARVVLARDLGRGSDQDAAHLEPAEVHAQDPARLPRELLRGAHHLDPSGLAPPADQHLRLHDDRIPEAAGRGQRPLDRRRDVSRRDRNSGRPEEVLGLEFVKIHRFPRATRADLRAAFFMPPWRPRPATPVPPRAFFFSPWASRRPRDSRISSSSLGRPISSSS